MRIENLIDVVGTIEKIAIEKSDQHPIEKEIEKLGVDMATTYAKNIIAVKPQSLTVMGIGLETVSTIKNVARKYNLEKVTLLPIPNHHGSVEVKIHMNGGDIKSFCRELGFGVDNTYMNESVKTEVQQLIDKYGVIVYEK